MVRMKKSKQTKKYGRQDLQRKTEEKTKAQAWNEKMPKILKNRQRKIMAKSTTAFRRPKTIENGIKNQVYNDYILHK